MNDDISTAPQFGDGSPSPPIIPTTPNQSRPEFHQDSNIHPPIVVQQPSESDSLNSHTTLMLPIPNHLTNNLKAPYVISDVINDTATIDIIGPDLASADVSIASDGSFVETPSGPAARELKKYWDHQIGVGMSVRSPYAITAFVNQHGKQMFRVGRRELSAPAANAAEIEERMTLSTSSPGDSPQSSRTKRRSRISMHAFPAMFKNGSMSSGTRSQAVSAVQPPAPRKLRKTRSIPDMVGATNDSSSPQSSSASGRVHSRSVTGADVSPFSTVVRNPNAGDIFAEAMGWCLPEVQPSSAAGFSTNSLSSSGKACPFGNGVTFDSPSRKNSSAEPVLPPPPLPRHLREVQSFESGLTARQVDHSKHAGKDSPLASEAHYDNPDLDRPPSALRLYAPSLSFDHSTDITPTSSTPEPLPELKPEQEPTLLSRYPTDIFDVLQTYRGLPLIEKLFPESEETTVIKLSLSADEGAAPRDDPRFVIWGEIQLDGDIDDQSVSHESVTDLSVNSSTSKRRSSKAKAVNPPSVRSSTGTTGETQKVLIAATIERWIAQLTSDLNYDELLDFFLTYRTYVSAVDLCHLFIARFHWALQHSSSPRDERVRRIVRVRTFVAIRYWLLTFFTVDFLPNRDLRLLMTDWLNSLIRDPILRKNNDGLGIVRKLIKVAKECKQAHAHSPPKPARTSVSSKQTPVNKEHVLGEKFAAATRKSAADDEDSDLDLDFVPNRESPDDTSQYPHDIANAHLGAATGLSPTRPSPIPFSSFSILQRTEHAPGPTLETDVTFVQSPSALPIHHSALSRAFVKTIGRLGRWRRVLNSRSANRTSISACADVSAFDLEITASRDLLTTNGGVEKYLKAAEPSTKAAESKTTELPPLPAQTPVVVSPPRDPPRDPLQSPPPINGPSNNEPPNPSPPRELPPNDTPSDSPLEPVEPEQFTLPVVTPPPDDSSDIPTDAPPLVHVDPPQPTFNNTQDDHTSIRSSTSTDSFGEPLTTAPTFASLAQPQWTFDIDDLDLSDTSSDLNEAGPSVPPGLRRPARKLPLRRDFEFVRRDTPSSMGIVSHESLPSNRSSHASNASLVGLGGNVAQWQLNALVDSLSDDEETGDVENALMRLEGQINYQKQQEKAFKVDGWVRTIQERMAAGDYEDEPPNFSDDSDEAELEKAGQEQSFEHDSASVHQEQLSPSIEAPENQEKVDNGSLDTAHVPVPIQTAHSISVPPGPNSPTRSTDAKPVPEDAVPIEILQSRVPSRPSTSSNRASLSRFVTNSEAPRVHRSFILNHRATNLAEHFAMIDRELFMGVKFEELVLDDWMNCKEVDVLDWVQYLKDRARWKVEKRYPDKTGALGAVRARFNLMANFTISEIVLTQPHERPMLVAKFIRIAWKAYLMCNFSTLVAIITGLRSVWVTKAMKRPGWSRVGMFENRMFKDLKVFTTTVDDFKYIRQIVTSIVDVKPLDASSHAASVVSGGTDGQSGKGKSSAERPSVPSACIPFIGIYLSQLQTHSRLPDLIDPTAPNEAVSINPVTSNFDALAHPEIFSSLASLPPSIHLEPLINVHKQRRIAGVIKSLVAGQQRASLIQFDVDKKLFQKCLRLRGLNADTLQKVLSMYSD